MILIPALGTPGESSAGPGMRSMRSSTAADQTCSDTRSHRAKAAGKPQRCRVGKASLSSYAKAPSLLLPLSLRRT